MFILQNLKILSVNEAWNELGVTSHQQRFTERIELSETGPVAPLTSNLHMLIKQ